MRPAPPIATEELEEVLEATRDDWEALRGERLLVTGGTGFFGTWLVASFVHAARRLDLGARMTVLTRDPASWRARSPELAGAPSVAAIAGDVRSFAAPEGRFSHLIHAATAASKKLNDESPLEMLGTIVDGTRHAMQVARAAGATRVLVVSSGAVYGRQPPELAHVAESFAGGPDPTDPGAAYAEGKRAAEQLAIQHGREAGLAVTLARGFAFVGPHLPLDAHFAIGNFLGDALAGRPIRVGGDGSPFRSYQYGSDLAAWLWTILLRGEAGRAYNVGSEEAISIGELARRVGARFGVPVTIAREPSPERPAERYVPSTARARTDLGAREVVSLDEAIERTARWHRRV